MTRQEFINRLVELGFVDRDPRIEAGQIAAALLRLGRTVAAVRMHLGQMTLGGKRT